MSRFAKNKSYAAGLFLLIFLALVGIIGMLLQNKIRMMFHAYVEHQVTDEVEMLAQRFDSRFGAEITGLQNLAQTVGTDSWERLLDSEEGRSMGVLGQRGHAIVGTSLNIRDWSGITQSFQGYPALSYCRGKGLLVTVPIRSGRNIRYVLYRKYSEQELLREFPVECFRGAGRVAISMSGNTIYANSWKWRPEDLAYMSAAEKTGILRQLRRMLYTSSAAALYDQDETIVFMADMRYANGQVIGFVNASVLDDELFEVMRLVIGVFGLLILLFVVGTVYLLEREKSAWEITKASQAKSAFLANMSHEIRTPINAVLGMNEMILRECGDEKIREYAQNASAAGSTLLSIINDILDISKVEAGKITLENEPYSLAALLHDVSGMVENRAKEKGLQYFVNADENLPRSYSGDVTRVRQVLINLVNNAVKYTPSGKVTLSVEELPSGIPHGGVSLEMPKEQGKRCATKTFPKFPPPRREKEQKHRGNRTRTRPHLQARKTDGRRHHRL